jgi:hypothetical protein
LTQNPAVLVSALRRIEGRSVIPGLMAGQDAMMIDGAHEGAFATHPTIAERVAAIISVTGSMALIAPARRDTRSSEMYAGGGFGRRPSPVRADYLGAVRQGTGATLAYNRLGLTPELTLGAVAAIGVFLWTHSADLAKPSALAAAFDPAPLRTYLAMSREGTRCQTEGIAWNFGLGAKPTGCDDGYEKMLTAHRGQNNIFGKIADAMPPVGMDEASGIYTRPNGTFGAPPLDYQVREVRRNRCFQASYSVERKLYSVTDQSTGDISMSRYLTYNDNAARNVMDSAPASRDLRIVSYYDVRKLMSQTIHRFFGDPGLQIAAARAVGPDHEGATAALRQRLSDPDFASKLGPLKQAEAEILVAAPQDFVSCLARRLQNPKKDQSAARSTN